MKNPEIECRRDIDERLGPTIDMSPGNFKSLFGPVPQPDTERINLTVNARELLAAFEQVISQFELTYDLAEGPITSEIGLEQPGRRYPDLEKAFEAAFPLNLEALPALDY